MDLATIVVEDVDGGPKRRRKHIDMEEITKGLYLGAESATKDAEILREINITHILTVNIRPLPEETSKQFAYKFVAGLDISCTDLLSRFEECFTFIEEGIQNGGVLVHCLVGCSRSATIVIGYLMYKLKKGFDEVLRLVKAKRPAVSPNEGFRSQLRLFEKMECRFDGDSEWYRKYRLEKLAERIRSSTVTRSDDRLVSDDYLRENPGSAPVSDDVLYKCKKCRQPLFRRSGVMSHTVGMGEMAFDWRGKDTVANQNDNVAANQSEAFETDMEQGEEICDRSLFIEPVKWMQDDIQVADGKLSCPKCSAKLGSFVWHGERCPCGAWIAPAFHIQTSKVDECKPMPLPAPIAR